MKQEIICPKCRSSLIGTLDHYAGEYHKFVLGTSKGNYICDQCVKPLPPGAECYALSIWTDDRPYSAWEHQYIVMKEPK